MSRFAVGLFGYEFTHAQIEMILTVIGSLFGLLVLWGVVIRSTKVVVTGLVVVAVCLLWWYGMNHGWMDGRLGPMP